MNTWKRTLEERVKTKLIPNKVVLLFGARRVGKTILLKQLIKPFGNKVLLMNGEDAETLALLENRSVSNYKALLSNMDLLAIDEAQNIPEIGWKLKLMVDELEGIRIIASGSSSFDLLNKAGEPLVGRCFQFHLYPFSQIEISQHENTLQTRQNLESRLIYGSYPEVVLMENPDQKKTYLKELVDAYLLKDILQLDGIKNAKKMKDLLALIALQVGSEVSLDELGKQLGMSRNTVEKYLDLLSKVFIIYRLGGYSGNLRKEISKASKWYFLDNGIRNALLGNFNPLAIRNDVGLLWENYLISERIKQARTADLDNQFFFWRTYDQQEIDLIEVSSEKMNAFEFKWGNKKARIPEGFKKNYPEAKFQIVSQDNYLEYIG